MKIKRPFSWSSHSKALLRPRGTGVQELESWGCPVDLCAPSVEIPPLPAPPPALHRRGPAQGLRLLLNHHRQPALGCGGQSGPRWK